MPHDNPNQVRISLEITVPVGVSVNVEREPIVPALSSGNQRLAGDPIDHPDNGGTTLVKQIGTRWYLCSYGTAGGGRHAFVRVYEGTVPDEQIPETTPPEGLDTVWDRIVGSAWRIDLVPLPAGAGPPWTTKKIAVWVDNGTTCSLRIIHTFTPQSSAYTYCDVYGQKMVPQKLTAKGWSVHPERWQFRMADSSDRSGCNCASLNGTWVLTRDAQAGDALTWHQPMPGSCVDPRRPSWWRLLFNGQDGFWYLECVTDLAQPVGTTIAYRRHESAWNPHGANELVLMTHHGYCNVPTSVTLYPA